eukprot:scaffold51284_cov67-Attheya_sp.AAC.2
MLVSKLPPDTTVFHSVLQPGVKPTEVTDMWAFIACHCANGAGMQKGFDYVESYAPVAMACSICITIALAGHSMMLAITDVTNAFQNTMIPIAEQITPLKEEGGKYCLQSVNAIQGTKPAGTQWNMILIKLLQHHHK